MTPEQRRDLETFAPGSSISASIRAALSDLDRVTAERDAHRANADRAAWNSQRMMEERDAAIAARDEAVAQARIKLLEEGATLLRHIDEFKGEQKWGANGANHYHVSCDVIDIGVGCFLSALDALRARKV